MEGLCIWFHIMTEKEFIWKIYGKIHHHHLKAIQGDLAFPSAIMNLKSKVFLLGQSKWY